MNEYKNHQIRGIHNLVLWQQSQPVCRFSREKIIKMRNIAQGGFRTAFRKKCLPDVNPDWMLVIYAIAASIELIEFYFILFSSICSSKQLLRNQESLILTKRTFSPRQSRLLSTHKISLLWSHLIYIFIICYFSPKSH